MNSRTYLSLFSLYVAGCLALLWVPIWHIASLALTTDQYSHILIIPFVSGYMLYRRRSELSVRAPVSIATRAAGAIAILAGVTVRALGGRFNSLLSINDSLSMAALSFVLLIIGGSVLFYGFPRAARFPLGFLFLIIPFPDFLLHETITSLQRGSAAVVSFLYSLLGVPFLRDGVVFHLPKGSIEIAEECSGIRSSLALLILSLLAGELFLRSTWRKVLLTASILPLVLVKNGIRIVVLSLLGFYVNMSFLTGRLHHQGGFLFFLLALCLWFPWLGFLRKSEGKRAANPPIAGASGSVQKPEPLPMGAPR